MVTISGEYEKWSMGKGTLKDYEGPFGFKNLLDGRNFNDLLGVYRKEHPQSPVLAGDVMGYGFILDELRIDRGLAIAQGKHPERPHGEYIIGDVFSEEPWKGVDNWLHNERFALLVLRALKVLGLTNLIDVYSFDYLVGKMTRVLAEGGKAFVQIPLYIIPLADEMARLFHSKYRVAVKLPNEKPVSAMEIIKG